MTHYPSLLAALGLITGEWEASPAPYAITKPQGGMSAEEQAAVLARLAELRDLTPARTDREAVAAVLRPLLGDDFEAYLELSLEELAIDRPDPRAPQFTADGVDAIVVGAGMSGLLAAHRLRQAGVRVTVLDRDTRLGGTWAANTYPGCRVDVPSHAYTYSCAAGEDWPDEFAVQRDVRESLEHFADQHGLHEVLELGVEVESADWDGARWQVRAGGRTRSATVLVSAVGQLSRPLIPELPGRFDGPVMHSASWDHSVDLTGKRVGVIGTGASAIQIVPELSAIADVTLYQRTAPWLLPTPELRAPIDAEERARLRDIPFYRQFYRLYLQRMVSDGLLPFARPGARNDAMRVNLTPYLESQGLTVPDYPPFAKRAVRDDGAWARALARSTVVREPIEALTASGVVAGVERPADALVYATGFEASRFLVPMRVTGPGGDLHERWGDDASAHLGVTVPGFPNLFLLYGPNTNVVVNSSAIFFSECAVRYLLGCVELIAGGAVLDCREDVHDAHRAWLDERNGEMVWGRADVPSWYRGPSGRITQNWPSTMLDYWQRTLAPDPAHFHIEETVNA